MRQSGQHASFQAIHWGAEERAGGQGTLLLHPAHLNAELHPLLATRTQRSGPVWSLGLGEGGQSSLTELVQTLMAARHLWGVRLILLGLSARAQGELALLFPDEVQDFVALTLPPERPLRTIWLQELWPLLNDPPSGTPRPFTARGAA